MDMTPETSPWTRPVGASKRMACSLRHVRTLIATGELPSYQRGGVVWLRVDDVDAYIAAGARNPDEAA